MLLVNLNEEKSEATFALRDEEVASVKKCKNGDILGVQLILASDMHLGKLKHIQDFFKPQENPLEKLGVLGK